MLNHIQTNKQRLQIALEYQYSTYAVTLKHMCICMLGQLLILIFFMYQYTSLVRFVLTWACQKSSPIQNANYKVFSTVRNILRAANLALKFANSFDKFYLNWCAVITDIKMSHLMTKPTKWHVCQQRQISLGIRPVWSVFAVRLKKHWSLATHWAHSEGSDQTWQTSESSLGAQIIFFVLTCGGSNQIWGLWLRLYQQI